MSKQKGNLKKLRSLIIALVFFTAFINFSLGTVRAAVPAGSGSGGSGTAATCNPDKPSDWYCRGLCNFNEHPDVAKDPQKVASCKCDGTPNLNKEQVTACKACQDKKSQSNCLENNRIVTRINQIVTFLSGLVALVITGSIIYAGIQYSLSGDKSDQSAAAKKRIISGLVALVAFILIYSGLQWLIPGGIFG